MNGEPFVTKQNELGFGTLMLAEYDASVRDTDVLPEHDLKPVLLGLYGEVGGIMSTTKKHVREQNAYPGFRRAAEEEFGDTLWYLAAYCRRRKISLESIFRTAAQDAPFITGDVARDIGEHAGVQCCETSVSDHIDDTLFQLGAAAAALLDLDKEQTSILPRLERFAYCFLCALHVSKLSLAAVAQLNIAKTRGAFISPDIENLPTFDGQFPEEERIPWNFRIRIDERKSGRCYLRWNNVFIGEPLTDNIRDPDGYRFHDVFHFAHAAILHWSPVFRALIRQKRKSDALYDEIEDGGRATVVEEGLTAWIFSQAKELNYFEGQKRISFGVLKTIQEFTAGYEVSRCPLKLWERAILDGYSVFRKVRDGGGGWVIGDRQSRTLRYEQL
jgi:hypothetical protein